MCEVFQEAEKFDSQSIIILLLLSSVRNQVVSTERKVYTLRRNRRSTIFIELFDN